MDMSRSFTFAAALALLAAPAAHAWESGGSWQPKVYPYSTHQNFCPHGLQPVSINGVICCGTPNQHVSYQKALRHPAPKKKVHKRAVRRSAPVVQYSKSPQGDW